MRLQHLALIALSLTSLGCRPEQRKVLPPVERPLAEQAEAVRSGASDRIQTTAYAATDEDLAQLAGIENLRELLLDHGASRLTPEGLKTLAALPKLEHLRIRGRDIDDAAALMLCELKSLRILNVPHATFSNEGLKQFKQLPDLEQLRFGSPYVTDGGIKLLRDFPSLKRLHLIDVQITEVGLRELAQIQQLESLYIDGGKLSDAAVEELFRARPDLHVHFNQQHHDRDPHRHEH